MNSLSCIHGGLAWNEHTQNQLRMAGCFPSYNQHPTYPSSRQPQGWRCVQRRGGDRGDGPGQCKAALRRVKEHAVESRARPCECIGVGERVELRLASRHGDSSRNTSAVGIRTALCLAGASGPSGGGGGGGVEDVGAVAAFAEELLPTRGLVSLPVSAR